MSEYIITIKQLATVIAKCHGLMPENEDGTPICNPREIAEVVDEPITLKEIVRCRDCKHHHEGMCMLSDGIGDFKRWYVDDDGFCSDGERSGE